MHTHHYTADSVPNTAKQRARPTHTRVGAPKRFIKINPIEWSVFVYAVFAFATCTSAFHLFGLATPALGLVYAAGTVLIILCVRQILAQPGMLALALLFPTVAVCSSIWSIDPAMTLRHAIQFAFSAMIGVCIGSTLHPRALFSAMTITFVALIVFSVANLWLQIVPAFQQKDYLTANEYFTGIFTHKNTLGLVLTLASVFLVFQCLVHKRFWPFALANLALFPILLFARSTTSIALYFLVMTMPVVYLLSKAQTHRLLLFTSTLCVLLTTVFVFEISEFQLVDFVLELAGKGRDLSGRTDLWSIAVQQIDESPWLGVGYQSYWDSYRNVGEVSLIRGMMESSIDTFHNLWLETLVGTGIVGFIAIAATPLVVVYRFLKHLVCGSSTAIHVAGLYLVMVMLIRANVETSLYFQHRIEHVALIALLFSTAASGPKFGSKEKGRDL